MERKNKDKHLIYTYGEEIDIGFIDNITRDDRLLMQSFKCENSNIQDFIRKLSYKEKGTVSYVSYDKRLNLPISIITIACSGIYVDQKKLLKRRIDVVPAIEIKYFAVNTSYRHLQLAEDSKLTLSKLLFGKYLKDIAEIAKNVCGAKKIILYSVPEAYSFYKKFGFIDFKKFMQPNQNSAVSDCYPMFISLE